MALYMDQTTNGNMWRFMNHNADVPNVKVQSFYDPVHKVEKIVVYAIKTIKPGDELVFDYGKTYWKN